MVVETSLFLPLSPLIATERTISYHEYFEEVYSLTTHSCSRTNCPDIILSLDGDLPSSSLIRCFKSSIPKLFCSVSRTLGNGADHSSTLRRIYSPGSFQDSHQLAVHTSSWSPHRHLWEKPSWSLLWESSGFIRESSSDNGSQLPSLCASSQSHKECDCSQDLIQRFSSGFQYLPESFFHNYGKKHHKGFFC